MVEAAHRTATIETGQTMAEYAVVLGVITVAIVTSFTVPVGRDAGDVRASARLRQLASLTSTGGGRLDAGAPTDT